MKRISFILFSVVFLNSLVIFSQDQSAQELIREGVEMHDEGEFEEAIDRYNEALEIDSTLVEAIYELSLSYLALKDYENAELYSTQIINSDDPKLSIGSYAVKSEALAEQNKVDNAIELLNQGLNKYGDDYQLHFNLALNHYKKADIDKTLFHVKRAIDLDKTHSGAFLLNAYALNDSGLWVQSVLSLQMFLLLEPDSKRSKNAFEEMLQTMQIKKTDKPVERSFIQQQMMRNRPDTASISEDTPPLSVEEGLNRERVYQTITTTLNSLSENSENIDEFTIFKTVNSEVMKILKSESIGIKEGIIWTFYIPFFSRISNSDYYDTFCRYISVSYFPESLEWWKENPSEAIDFVTWFEKGDSM